MHAEGIEKNYSLLRAQLTVNRRVGGACLHADEARRQSTKKAII